MIRTAYPAPIAYTYEASHHCPACAAARFGVTEKGWIPEEATDSEGNSVGAIAPWDEWQADISEPDILSCDDCGLIIEKTHLVLDNPPTTGEEN